MNALRQLYHAYQWVCAFVPARPRASITFDLVGTSDTCTGCYFYGFHGQQARCPRDINGALCRDGGVWVRRD